MSSTSKTKSTSQVVAGQVTKGSDLTPPIDCREMRADARRNRQRILEVAEATFAEEGLAVPIDEIARRACVGVGTIYRHFPTKEALFEAIVIERMERLIEEAEPMTTSDDPGNALIEFIERVGFEATRKRDLTTALTSAGIDFKARIQGTADRLRAVLGTLLERAQSAGAVRGDVGIDDLFGLIMGTCMASEHAEDMCAAQRRMMSVVLAGLRPQSGSSGATRRSD